MHILNSLLSIEVLMALTLQQENGCLTTSSANKQASALIPVSMVGHEG